MTKIVNCDKCINFKYGSHSHYCLLGVRLRFVKTDLPGLKDDPGFRRRCEKYEPVKNDVHSIELKRLIGNRIMKQRAISWLERCSEIIHTENRNVIASYMARFAQEQIKSATADDYINSLKEEESK